MTTRPDHSTHDAIIAERQTAAFDTPPGGYPSANPAGTQLAPTARTDATTTRSAARELSAYGDQSYSESTIQAKRDPATSEGLDAFDPTI